MSCPGRFAALAFLLGVVTACTPLDPVELPELTLVNMTLADMTLFETEARFEVRIANVNPEPLTLDGGAVDVYVEGIKIGRGLMSERVQVPRFDSVTVTLPVFVNNLSVATRLRPILKSKRLSYRIKGVLYQAGAGARTRKLRTSSEGEFDFGAPPSPAP